MENDGSSIVGGCLGIIVLGIVSLLCIIGAFIVTVISLRLSTTGDITAIEADRSFNEISVMKSRMNSNNKRIQDLTAEADKLSQEEQS